ncbi:LTA synthase family protein [Dellaglioa sp. BT-FLS60]
MIILERTVQTVQTLKRFRTFLNTKLGFFTLLLFLFWLKTITAYLVDFKLGVSGIYQYFILLLNPIGTTMLLLGLALYIKKPVISYLVMFLIYIANSALLFFNIIYYREFTDFMTINTMLGYSKVSEGISGSSFALMKPHDIFYIIDLALIILLFLTRFLKFSPQPFKKTHAFAITSFSIMLTLATLTLGEIDRPQLITRTFDRNYIVKYLGIDSYTVYDSFKTVKNNRVRDTAESYDLNDVLDFTKSHYAAPNPSMYGIAKGKNVIVIHLESFQQFLINFKVNGKEVTPFLNSLYNGKETYSFPNFFNQVGQGKTSDAENLLETSVYGLAQGSVFTSLGSENTFEAAPAILNQTSGYSSAVFHGNTGSFWNRDSVYKSMGYQYFFDSSYYDTSANNTLEYGLKDKLLFNDSVKYLEKLQQPFYAKFITVSNHFPFGIDAQNKDFEVPNTGDTSVNNYFQTAHYLDESVKELFTYLKKSGLYDNSMIVLYGDHYGISDSRNVKLAQLLGKSSETWSSFDNTQLQRVPFMLHIPGTKNGGVQKQYGGEVDVLPTLLHLLGIDSSSYVQFGTDLFSKNHDQTVAFRNENFITPDYTVLDSNIYDNATGKEVTHPSAAVEKTITKDQSQVSTELSLSDTVNNQNLLRYYTPKNFKPVQPSAYNYKNQYSKLLKLQESLKKNSTSLYSKNGNKSTTDLYKTDAPELKASSSSSSSSAISSSTTSSSSSK